MSEPDQISAPSGDRTPTSGSAPSARRFGRIEEGGASDPPSSSDAPPDVRTELAWLRSDVMQRMDEVQREVVARFDALARRLDELAERTDGAATSGEAEARRRLDQIGDEVAGVHVTVQDLLADAQARTARRLAQVEATLQRSVEATSTAVRSSVADVGGRSAQELQQLRAATLAGFDGLRDELAGAGAGPEIAAVRTELRDQLLGVRRSVTEGFNAEALARDLALARSAVELRTDLATTVSGIDASIARLHTSIAEVVAERSGDVLASTQEELERVAAALATVLAQAQREQERALRVELTDALASVSELVVDLAHQEARARVAGLETTARRMDELARRAADLLAGQAELRELIISLWG